MKSDIAIEATNAAVRFRGDRFHQPKSLFIPFLKEGDFLHAVCNSLRSIALPSLKKRG